MSDRVLLIESLSMLPDLLRGIGMEAVVVDDVTMLRRIESEYNVQFAYDLAPQAAQSEPFERFESARPYGKRARRAQRGGRY